MEARRTDGHEGFWDSAYRRGEHRLHWESIDAGRELAAALNDRLLGDGGRALDVGCGAGLECLWLAQRGFEVVGVDTSRVALELARRRAEEAGLTVEWRRGSALALPLADRSVELAIDRGCLHVISRRSRRRYAREIARVLKPGGRLIVWAARQDDDEEGVIGLSGYELNRLLAPRGFGSVETATVQLAARSGVLDARRFTAVKRTA